MDETYINVKGQWKYYYRAVDKYGDVIDFLLRDKRDEKAAIAFFQKAIGQHGIPEKVVIDGSHSNTLAIDLARRKGFKSIYGFTSKGSRVHSFYERLGFTVTSEAGEVELILGQ